MWGFLLQALCLGWEWDPIKEGGLFKKPGMPSMREALGSIPAPKKKDKKKKKKEARNGHGADGQT
jgi:hypothetical protein